jgi:outer membrane receptor protein involved in Fe transport
MNRRAHPCAAIVAAAIPFYLCVPRAGAASEPASELDEVIVTATLRPEALASLPASITVLGEEDTRGGGAQHFGDVLGQIPNVNFAGGTARPRYFQIRGIGELDQYEGAPNPSVGFVIDDIDFTGISMPANLFDVARVEVLRGPQGTAYGANALAGLINMVSNAPRPGFQARAQAELGDYGERGGGVVLNDSLGDEAAWRVAAHAFKGDGYRRNAFLGRDDTNGFDEAFVRARLRATPREDLEINLTALYADSDDGYDAWAIDNSRTTQSDKPGVDAQLTRALALRVDYATPAGPTLRSVSTVADSAIHYSFDGDWGNDAFWGVNAPYDFFEDTRRDRRTFSQELRLSSPSGGPLGWVVGAYALRLTESNSLVDLYNGDVSRLLGSDYAATSLALYGQVDADVGAWSLTAGLRGEQRRATYDDNAPLHFAPRDTMLGGHLSARRHVAESTDAYVSLSRGYKAGGFNLSFDVPPDRRVYDPEFLWNLESGLDWHDAGRRVELRAAVFYMRRTDQQVSTSYQADPANPLTFVFLTDNAARGENYGVESQVAWRPAERLRLGATLGLLRARFIEYTVGGVDQSGIEPPHAPSWTYGLQAEWSEPRGFYARAELNGVDAFAFSASHDQRSSPYHLVNLRAGFARNGWNASAWTRNLLDRHYATRGFYFGNEPPDFADKRYVDNGDPRQIGVTVSVDF